MACTTPGHTDRRRRKADGATICYECKRARDAIRNRRVAWQRVAGHMDRLLAVLAEPGAPTLADLRKQVGV
jgi:hypothetical protein